MKNLETTFVPASEWIRGHDWISIFTLCSIIILVLIVARNVEQGSETYQGLLQSKISFVTVG